MSPDDPRHGTRRGFDVHRKAGQVACDACKRAAAKYEQERLLDLMAGKPRQIDATGTRRRIQALARLGWTSDDLGLNRKQVWHLTQQTHVLRATAEAIEEAYERLSMSLGPSTVTRSRAERKGWPPPLAWVDIDDPDETPAGWEYRPATRAEQFADLVDQGGGVTEVATRLGLTRRALEKWCERNGHSATFSQLVARETAVFEYRNQHAGRGAA